MIIVVEKINTSRKGIADFIEHIELSSRPDFNQYFIENMDFPRENLW